MSRMRPVRTRLLLRTGISPPAPDLTGPGLVAGRQRDRDRRGDERDDVRDPRREGRRLRGRPRPLRRRRRQREPELVPRQRSHRVRARLRRALGDLVRRSGRQRRARGDRRQAADNRFPQFGPAPDRLAFISDRRAHPRRGLAVPLRALRAGLRPTEGGEARGRRPSELAGEMVADGRAARRRGGQECLRWGIYVVGSEAPGQAAPPLEPMPVRGRRRQRHRERDALFRHPQRPRRQRLHRGGRRQRPDRRRARATTGSPPGPETTSIFGGPGDDILSGGSGNDTIYGGPGHDKIGCGPGNDTAYIGPGDTVRDCEHVHKS